MTNMINQKKIIEYIGNISEHIVRDKTKKHILDFVHIDNCPQDMYLVYEYENVKIFHSESAHATLSVKFE